MSQIQSYSIGGIVPAAIVETLTGNSGGPVGPTANNINVVGGTGINIVGNPGTSTLTVSTNGLSVLNYTPVAASPYVVLATDDFISVDSSAIPITIELPNTTTTGRVITIKDRTRNAFVNNITITTVGGVVTIDGVASAVQNTNGFSLNVIFNGSNYEVW